LTLNDSTEKDKVTADGGIVIEKDATASFDPTGNLATKTAGYWKGLPGKRRDAGCSMETMTSDKVRP